VLQEFLPILLLFFVGLAIFGGIAVLSFLIGPRNDDPKKLDTYECGMPPIGSPKEKFTIRFFLVAVLFVIFDIEVVFLFMWAIVFKQLGLYGLLAMSVFLLILVFSLIYEMKKGVLDWASKTNS
jgi:NADH-quinone oxidoreductase subunit A